MIDPHTAVGLGVLEKMTLKNNTAVLGTAHPSKFSNIVMQETGVLPELPKNLKKILNQEEKFIKLPKDLKKVKEYILNKIS